MELFKQFCLSNKANGLIQPGDKIILGVSGGVDSIVMLNLFHRLKNAMNLSLTVAHVNHRLRGESADQDEAFVAFMSDRYNVPFFSKKVDVAGLASSAGKSIEEAARILRYQFFNELLGSIGYSRIALAHHADDQAETIFLNIIRGSGLRGISGMRYVNGRLIRPLLFACRKEIETYAAEQQLEYRVDQTNFDRRYRRNRIRLDIMGELKTNFGGRVVKVISRLGESADESQLFIDHEADKAFSKVSRKGKWGEIILDIYSFLKYFKAVQKGILSKIVESLTDNRICIDSKTYARIFDLVEKAASGKRLAIAGPILVAKCGGKVVFIRKQINPTGIENAPIGIKVELWHGMRFNASLVSRFHPGQIRAKRPNTEYLDYDKINFPLRIRTYQTGDKLIPLGMVKEKKLKKFFIDQKVPNYLRTQIPLLFDSTHLLWVTGYRIDDRIKITKETKRVLMIKIENSHITN